VSSLANDESVRAAARRLESGELVAFPTETVYGLGADAENPDAVALIYRAKGRPANHPLIVHLAQGADVGYWSSDLNHQVMALIDQFWPGPLTLILKRAAHIPDAAAGGQQSIGLRCPAHPIAQALLRYFKAGKGGIAAPSANRFGQVSPTTAAHVWNEFHDVPLVNCVLDGGQSEVGIESTIIDLSRGMPVLLRPGHISAQQASEILGMPLANADEAAPRAPGTLASHYAPSTPVILVATQTLAATMQKLSAAGQRIALMHHTNLAQIKSLAAHDCPTRFIQGNGLPTVAVQMADDPIGYAHALYVTLRRLDEAKTNVIVIESVPELQQWYAVNDRLQRAAFGSAQFLSRL
jgi:L-threonylcarbamoyladenylate synthase